MYSESTDIKGPFVNLQNPPLDIWDFECEHYKIKAMNVDTLNFLKSLFLFEPEPNDNYTFNFEGWLAYSQFQKICLSLVYFRNRIMQGHKLSSTKTDKTVDQSINDAVNTLLGLNSPSKIEIRSRRE